MNNNNKDKDNNKKKIIKRNHTKFIDTFCRQCKILLPVVKLSPNNICPECVVINQRKSAKASAEDYEIMYRI